MKTIEDFMGDRIIVEDPDETPSVNIRLEGVTRRHGVVLREEQIQELRDHLDEILGETRQAPSIGTAYVNIVPRFGALTEPEKEKDPMEAAYDRAKEIAVPGAYADDVLRLARFLTGAVS